MRRRSKTSVQAKVVVVEVLVRRRWVASVGRLVGRMEQRARVKGNVDSAHVGHPLAAWFSIRTRSTLPTLHSVSIIKIPATQPTEQEYRGPARHSASPPSVRCPSLRVHACMPRATQRHAPNSLSRQHTVTSFLFSVSPIFFSPLPDAVLSGDRVCRE